MERGQGREKRRDRGEGGRRENVRRGRRGGDSREEGEERRKWE